MLAVTIAQRDGATGVVRFRGLGKDPIFSLWHPAFLVPIVSREAFPDEIRAANAILWGQSAPHPVEAPCCHGNGHYWDGTQQRVCPCGASEVA